MLLVAGFLVANHLLNSYSAHFLDVLARRGKKHGVIVAEPVFRSAGITGLRSAKWDGLYAELEFPDSEAFDPKKKFEVRISRLDGLLASGQVTLVADELAIDAFLPADEDDSDDTPASQERVTAKRVQCSFPMSLSDPSAGTGSRGTRTRAADARRTVRLAGVGHGSARVPVERQACSIGTTSGTDGWGWQQIAPTYS